MFTMKRTLTDIIPHLIELLQLNTSNKCYKIFFRITALQYVYYCTLILSTFNFHFDLILKGIFCGLIAFTTFIIFFMVQGATIFVLLISNVIDTLIGFNIWHIGLFLVFWTFMQASGFIITLTSGTSINSVLVSISNHKGIEQIYKIKLNNIIELLYCTRRTRNHCKFIDIEFEIMF